uniref:Dolichyl-P-Glc:Glc(2)Man(9)GlcNAc(2)-PP-dolichol alpha-1,2-glucosyltransferase n=1 Tax=Anguilla anguilla TaxID=7936 RepID=A0A0E9QTG1_ANGAN
MSFRWLVLVIFCPHAFTCILEPPHYMVSPFVPSFYFAVYCKSSWGLRPYKMLHTWEFMHDFLNLSGIYV